MPDTWDNLIVAIHASEHPTVLAVTGGGSAAVGQLLAVPGASRTLLEAVVPYASSALTDWLGGPPEQYCSEQTARAMAMAAWMRARELNPDGDPHMLIGIGATASLASDRPKRGDHRIHVAAQTATETTTYSLVLAKDQRERADEEAIAARLTLLALGRACGADVEAAQSTFRGQLSESEIVETIRTEARDEWTDLIIGKVKQVCGSAEFKSRALLCGAFNPPHQGHGRMAIHAAQRLDCPVAYELSITNVDKPPLDFREIERRTEWLRGETASDGFVLTDAPTFRAKADLFAGCTFVVGADTIARVGDPKYYTGDVGTFDAAIEQIARQGCRFLVFGREIDGKFRVLSDIDLPAKLRELCDEVTAEEFREDVSSTELRENSDP